MRDDVPLDSIVKLQFSKCHERKSKMRVPLSPTPTVNEMPCIRPPDVPVMSNAPVVATVAVVASAVGGAAESSTQTYRCVPEVVVIEMADPGASA